MRSRLLLSCVLLAGCSKPSEPPAVEVAQDEDVAAVVQKDQIIKTYGCGGEVRPRIAWTPAMQAVADGNNRFACDLFAELRKEPGNLFVSPFSIHTALAMTADGARGSTLAEMVKTLHLPNDSEARLASGDVARYYAAGGEGYELAVANDLWGQKGYPWKADFLDRQKSRYGAGLTPVDFIVDANREAARQTINAAVEKATRDKIKELLKKGPPPDLTNTTKLVLTNAIYFKAAWEWNFNKRSTHEAAFTLRDGSKKNVSLMSRNSGHYAYMETDEFQAIELPYKGGAVSMVILLPRKHDGLAALEERLTEPNLRGWIKDLKKTRTDLHLPKFRCESRFDLGGVLGGKMGMPLAFDKLRADLTGMAALAPSENLYIFKVVHQSFVDVNEDGTEAAAATVVIDNMFVVLTETKIFRADRPFLYLIRDTKTGAILFLGRYAGP